MREEGGGEAAEAYHILQKGIAHELPVDMTCDPLDETKDGHDDLELSAVFPVEAEKRMSGIVKFLAQRF